MEDRRLMARVCTILIPTRVSEAVWNRQIISRANTKTLPTTEGFNSKGKQSPWTGNSMLCSLYWA